MHTLSARIVLHPGFSSSPSGPRLLGEILPDVVVRIGLRAIDHQLALGDVDEARQIAATLHDAAPFVEREAA